jgi:nitrogen-specific signal transduction histidine kinase
MGKDDYMRESVEIASETGDKGPEQLSLPRRLFSVESNMDRQHEKICARRKDMSVTRDNKDDENVDVETYFAPAVRASREMLRKEIEIISQNPVIDMVMDVIGGLVAILNEHRQIIAINKTLLKTLGIDDVEEALGLRLGEAIQCIHAHENPGGCGTSRYCSTCGAAIAIVTSLAHDSNETRTCEVAVERDGKKMDLCFQVRCLPLSFRGERFLLLFLQDITLQQQRAALERAFFHDINNTIGGLVLSTQLLEYQDGKDKASDLIKRVQQLSVQLGKEVEIQSVLSQEDTHTYQVVPQKVSVREVLQEMQRIFAHHPASTDKTLDSRAIRPDVHLVTDISLLRRILMNMLVNAFEATAPGGKVWLWAEPSEERVTFCVWNRAMIPEDIALRVFQRNFSTKSEPGRGMGTYIMKLFGETYLGGEVSFTTSEARGTVFRLCLPKKLPEVSSAV